MTAVSRNWATPLTIGVFAVMAATGVLMFFHLESGLQKAVHEWLGWLMVAAVSAHAAANWGGFKRYLQRPGMGRTALAACMLAFGATFFVAPQATGNGAPPPVLAMRAVGDAPLATVAALAGTPVEQLRTDLAAAGIDVASDEQSIVSVVGGDRERLALAMRTAFQAREAVH
jgi:hypothetical protein